MRICGLYCIKRLCWSPGEDLIDKVDEASSVIAATRHQLSRALVLDDELEAAYSRIHAIPCARVRFPGAGFADLWRAVVLRVGLGWPRLG